MSTTIDEKVVELKFDNSSFESNVSTTMSTIDKLKSKLNFKGSSEGIEEVAEATRNCDFSSMSEGVDEVKVKFSALQTVALTVISNITTKIQSMASSLVSAFTIDPIKSGFEEYETQINAVQTILANTSSKGTTLDEVNAALDELNKYADLTIYNFTEMTKNIGTFTAAGIDLDTSVSAIQGIANLAAVSGSTSQQASTAMYQLSQALAAGTVKLMDWNSVVNAGMGGEVFQNALKATAESYGTDVDALIEEAGSFRESLSEGWITSEVLTETLSKFTKSGVNEYLAENSDLTVDQVTALHDAADAASDTDKAYAEMAETIAKSSDLTADDIEELVSMSTTAEDAATKVKTLTQLMDTLKEAAQSGWTQSWEIIIGDFEEAKELFTEISDYFSNWLSVKANRRNSILEGAMTSSWDQLVVKIENAGLSENKFKKALKEVAKEHGVSINKMIKEAGSFEDSLEEGWLTTEIFTDAISNLTSETDNLSGSTVSALTKLSNEAQGLIARGSELLDSSNWDQLAARIEKIGVSEDDFQNALKVAAEQYGISVDEMIEKTGSFEASLEEGWLTSRIFSKAITGIIQGYDAYGGIEVDETQIDKLKRLRRQINNEGGTNYKQTDDLLSSMSEQGGRDLLIDSFRNLASDIIKPIRRIATAFRSVFTFKSDQLYAVIKAFHTFTETIALSEKQLTNLKWTFKGIFTIVKMFTSVIGFGLQLAFKGLGKIINSFDGNILEVTGSIGKVINKFYEWVTSGQKLRKVFDDFSSAKGLSAKMEVLGTAFSNLKDRMTSELNATDLKKPETLLGLLKNLKETIQTKWQNSDFWLVNVIKAFFQLPLVSSFISAFKNVGSLAFEKLGTLAKSLKEELSELFHKLTEMDTITWDTLDEAIINAASNIRKSLSSINTDFTGFGDFFSGLKDNIITNSKNMGNILSNIGAKIVEFAQIVKSRLSGNIGLGEILTVAFGSGFLAVIFKVAKGLDAVIEPIAELGEIFESTKRVLRSFALELKAKALRTAAEAILMIAAALFILAMIDTKKLWSAVGAVVVIMLVLGALVVLLDNANKTSAKLSKKGLKLKGSMNTVAFTIAAIGISILMMAASLKLIASIEKGQMAKCVVVLGILAAVLTAMVILINKSSRLGEDEKTTRNMLTILAIAVSLNLIVRALKKISRMTTSDLIVSMGVLITVMILMKVLMKSAKGVDVGGAATIVAMAVMLNLIVVALRGISRLDGDAVIQNIFIVAGVMIAMLVFVKALSKIENQGQGSLKVGMSIIAMAMSLIIIARALQLIAKIDTKSLIKATIVVELLMATMIAMVLAMNEAEGKVGSSGFKVGASLLMMAVSVGILAGVILLLSQISTAGLIQAAAVVAGIEAIMIGLISASKTTEKANTKALTRIAIILALLAISLGTLSMIDPANLIPAAASLSAVIGMTSLLVLASKNAKKAKSGTILIMAIIVELTAALYLLSSMPVQNTLAATASLSILLLSLAASLKILGKMKKVSIKAYASMLLMGTVLYELIGVLAVLNKMDGSLSIETAASLSVLMIALAGVVRILSKIPASPTALAGGMIGIALIVALVAALIPISASLRVVGKQLSKFMENMQGFFDGASQFSVLDSEFLTGVRHLIRAVALLSAGSIISGITTLGGLRDVYGKFGTNLSKLGDGLVAFSNSISGLSDEDITKIKRASRVTEALVKLSKSVPKIGGLKQLITGFGNFKTFGKQLAYYGEALVSYSTSINDLSEDDVTKIKQVTRISTALVELADAIPNMGGLVSIFTGNTGFKKLGKQLVKYGESLVEFTTSISGIGKKKINKINNVVEASKALVELTNSVDVAGASSFFTGEGNLTGFANNIGNFALGIASFAENTKGVKKGARERIAAVAEAATPLVQLCKKIQAGGVLSVLSGEGNFSGFATGLGEFANGLGLFIKNTENLTDDDIKRMKTVAKAAKPLSNLCKNIQAGGVLSVLTGEGNFDGFSEGIANFALGVKKFVKKTDGLDTSNISGVCKDVKPLVTLLSDVDVGGVMSKLTGAGNVEGFVDNIGYFGEGLMNFLESVSGFTGWHAYTIQRIAESVDPLIDMCADIKNNGIFSAFAGGDIGTFGFNLVSFGESLMSFAEATEGIDSTAFQQIIQASFGLSTLAETIGSNDDVSKIVDFGVYFDDYGTAFSNFYRTIQEIDSSQIANLVVQYNNLLSLILSIANSNITGDSVSGFEEALNRLGHIGVGQIIESFTNASGEFKEIGLSIIETISDGVQESSMAGITTTLHDRFEAVVTYMNSYSSDFLRTGKKLMSSLSDGLTYNYVPTDVADIMGAIIHYIKSFDSGFLNAGKYLIEQFAEGFTFNYVPTDIADIMGAIIHYIRSFDSGFFNAGEYVFDEFVEGLTWRYVPAEVADMMGAIINYIRDYRKNFHDAGAYLVEGFANGISDNTWQAKEKAQAMAKAAKTAANKELDEESPSKEGYKTGAYYVEGFVNGIVALTASAYTAGEDMANAAKTGLNTAIAKISSYLDDNMDASPTITPVVDLSNVESGAASIGDMLAFSPSVGFMSNLGAISYMDSSRIQNGFSANDDVVKAIHKLGNDIGNAGGDTYSVNGVTYDDGSNIASAIKDITRAARISRRV